MKVKTETVLVFLIGILVLMAGVQAVQLNALTQALEKGVTITAGGSAAAPAKSSVLSQLPTQVGGCG